jgi:cbb3-type cytochrome oxidase maturation protein
MNAFILMLPGIVGLALAGLAAFSWALKSGQFEDPKGAAARILDESDHPG